MKHLNWAQVYDFWANWIINLPLALEAPENNSPCIRMPLLTFLGQIKT